MNIFQNLIDTPENIEIPPDDENEPQLRNLDKEKKEEEIRKLKIENETKLKNLFENKLMKAIMAEIGQAIKQAFVYAGRREAPTMAAKLGIPQKERDLQAMIDDINEKGVAAVIDTIEKLMDDEIFE